MKENSPYVNLRVGTGKFIHGNGSIAALVKEVSRLGGRPLVIGGPTTTPLVLNAVQDDFSTAGIEPVVRVHTGACSRNWAEIYKNAALENKCTVIVGIGGGKCIDLAKCTATFANMDLITVPTSVATCVATSAVCIMYHDDGIPDGSVQMHKEVDVCIADTQIIATAPKCTLAAGILDSIAKLPEVVHNLKIETYHDCLLEKYICTINSRGIYAFLMGEGRNAYDNGIASGRLSDIITTNLLHTSVVSGFSCGVDQLALAHGLYDCVRRSFTKEAAHKLHGEIVGVGVLMQLKFNEMDAACEEVHALMQHMKMPVCLSDLGILPSEENLQVLIDYLIPATALTESDIPRLEEALSIII